MSDWNQFDGDARHSGTRREYEGPERLEEAWSVELSDPMACSPIVDRGVVYVGTERGELYAIDADKGSRRWVADGATGDADASATISDASATATTSAATTLDAATPTTAAVTTPVATADAVYVARADGSVTALDDRTGAVRWTYEGDAPLESALTLAAGVLLVGDGAGVVALEPETGKLVWRAERETDDEDEADDGERETDDEPGTIPDATAIDGDGDGGDGAEPDEPEPDEPAVGAPAVGDGRVYVGLRDGGVRALDLETGTELWRAPTDGTVVDGPTFVEGDTADDDRLYVADDDGTMLALSPETGQTWFTYEIRDAFTSGPTVLEETIFLSAADGHLHVTDTTFGNRKLRGLIFSKKGLELDGVAHHGPVVVGDVVLVGDSRGRLYAIDADDPDFLWHHPLETPVATAFAVGERRLYVGGADDHLYCLRWDRSF